MDEDLIGVGAEGLKAELEWRAARCAAPLLFPNHSSPARSRIGVGGIFSIMKTISLPVTGMTCAACQARVQRALAKSRG